MEVAVSLDDLVDIRENSAYIAFVALIGGYINYAEDGYKILAKEYKREIKYSSGNLMENQLRQVVEQSAKMFLDFFECFCSLETLIEQSVDANRFINKAKKKQDETFKNHYNFTAQDPFGKEMFQTGRGVFTEKVANESRVNKLKSKSGA